MHVLTYFVPGIKYPEFRNRLVLRNSGFSYIIKLMKKLIIFLLLILTLLLFLPVSAQEEGLSMLERKVSDEMIELLTQNLDNLFPITVKRDYFNTPGQALYSDNGPETIIEISNDLGKHNFRMFANADTVHDHIAFEFFDEAYETDFQLTMDVTVNDTWPMGQGGCFVGFTNYGVSAFADAETFALVTDAKNVEIYHRNQADDSGSHYLLETRGKNPAKLSIIHLTGHTYVYVDGIYAGQIHDGLKGPFHLMYGSMLFTEGDAVGCSFDNLVIRKLGN